MPRGKLFVRVIEYADGDEHVRPAIKQIVPFQPCIPRISGTKPSFTRRANSSTIPRLTLYFLMLANMFLPSRSASGTAWQTAELHDNTLSRCPLDGSSALSVRLYPGTWREAGPE